ncbi:hypothetical protein [Methylobacter sp.]|uniref:hypothetical protein n=1 Tax=Methylobacter sp. TaxID=2051955 RepID=UPI0012207574|nr:hypothetical protein [Methylobacter sp.]TAK59485.1 MAG: hypothetical protein EPO18_20190 [Methylobacter sp.]
MRFLLLVAFLTGCANKSFIPQPGDPNFDWPEGVYEHIPPKRKPGELYELKDGCNTCKCKAINEKTGICSCTLLFCS